jgi:hypothetical protein
VRSTGAAHLRAAMAGIRTVPPARFARSSSSSPRFVRAGRSVRLPRT